MARYFDNWLKAYLQYSEHSEAPTHMHFWTGVSTIAGALRRQVWIDNAHFKWYPNFYVILVAPPGVVSKSTTAGIGMSLLRQVPDIKFGPDVVTWQALVTGFAESTIAFEHEGNYYPMSAMTIESSEFGNLLNPSDTEMIDLLVSLWDSKPGVFEKRTKGSGTDQVENPWINVIACTTPSWISGNFPQYMIGGGFTSRCIFVYAEKKSKCVAYPGLMVPRDFRETGAKLVHDLIEISKIKGEYKLSSDAIEWGSAWYKNHIENPTDLLDLDAFGGYLARKQTHIHKLAMVLAASESDRLILTQEHLALAETMVTDLEPDMQYVFSKIGKPDDTVYIEKLIQYIHQRGGCSSTDAYRFIHRHFPKASDFEGVLTGAIRAGYIVMKQEGHVMKLLPGVELETAKGQKGN